MAAGRNSAGELLQLFRTGTVGTRGELQRVTGLARSTLSHRVDALLAAGYLTEDGSVADPRRGRPSTRLRVNDQAATVLIADLGATHGRLAVSTAAGDVINETVIESAIEKGPSTVLDTVTGELDAMLKRSGRAETLRGVGMGVPGPVDWHTGRIARSISMPGWDNYPVSDHLASHYSVPAVVDNDANLLGLGEQRRIYPGTHLVLFVKIGTGIGASMIMDGQLVRGSDSAEGDIGHAKIPGVEETCLSCGEPGCLAAIASGRALIRDLRRLGHTPATTRDVVDLVRRGDPDAVRIVTAAGRALGDVLSMAVSLLNPDVLVIGGDIAHAYERFVRGVRDTLLHRTQPLATAHLVIARTRLGDRAGIMGAAAMVADSIFGIDAVDAAVS